jgi:PTS system galactitol-specific IIA component
VSLFSPELCIPRLEAKTAEDVIRALSTLLESKGHVLPSFAAAAVMREKRSPTGLPFPDAPVALPHAEPQHVQSPACAVATLATPVKFRQMGSPAIVLDATIALMPALTAKEQAAAGLASLLEMLQNEALRKSLLAASTADAMYATISSEAGG